jgi:hypothetical protein
MKKLALIPILLAGCGGGDEDSLTVYLKQRLGPEGPHSQIAPVLMPVEREAREGIPPEHQAALEVRVGPSPDERAHGFLDTVEPETRIHSVTVEGGTAIVELVGTERLLCARRDRLLADRAIRNRTRSPSDARKAMLRLPLRRHGQDGVAHAPRLRLLAGRAVRRA